MIKNSSTSAHPSGDGAAYGDVVIRCRSAAKNSVVGLIVSAVIAAALVVSLLRSSYTTLVTLLIVVLLIALACLFFISLVRLIKPLTMMDVTTRGIILYYNHNKRLDEKFFIPWERIASMKMVMRKLNTGKGTTPQPLIATELRVGDDWRLPAQIKRNQEFSRSINPAQENSPDTIEIDANPMTPRGAELLPRLKELHARYANE